MSSFDKILMKFVALVVVYNFDSTLLKENVGSYLNYVDYLYILDNSDVSLLTANDFANEKCFFIQFGCNRGIAYALDYGCRKALREGYSWIFTFDQDSKVSGDYINSMTSYILQLSPSQILKIGLIAPIIKLQNSSSFDEEFTESTIVDVAMTSGCCMNLSVYSHMDGFREELFIDWVDNDYCYQLKRSNYLILRLNKCILFHHLGACVEYEIFGKHLLYVTHHSYIRYYYKTRNALYLSIMYFKQFPLITCKLLKSIFIDIFKILLFEKNKFKKMRFVTLGIVDYFLCKMGKCVHK